MRVRKKWFQYVYVQETAVFLIMFILTMLHEWIRIDTLKDLFEGLAFFMLVYGHAQFHRFFIFPFFAKNRFLIYGLLAIVSVAISTFVLYLIDYYWLAPDFYHEITLFEAIIYHFAVVLISTIAIMSLFLFREYLQALQKRSRDALLINEMNMLFLRSQLNPHFFFNMLNNLYGVSLTEPERTPSMIVKISGLMRYQLEKGSRERIALNEELTFIGNYIDLERERIGKRCDIKFTYLAEELLPSPPQIAPLLLIVLIENAFKHSTATRDRWYVHIDILLKSNIFRIHINNSNPDQVIRKNSTGIGLENFRQRLDLMYPGKYQYSAKEGQEGYQTTLILELND
ncbi:histidine kinase [Chitinophaga sp.]|uniref:sensor histidine kinase n=1 Tax=Chitinophaga sp. TaxID=1869181 RepID=UPI0031DC4F0A